MTLGSFPRARRRAAALACASILTISVVSMAGAQGTAGGTPTPAAGAPVATTPAAGSSTAVATRASAAPIASPTVMVQPVKEEDHSGRWGLLGLLGLAGLAGLRRQPQPERVVTETIDRSRTTGR